MQKIKVNTPTSNTSISNNNDDEDAANFANNNNKSQNMHVNASMLLLQSERSQETDDVDPKSQLANKTIFKSDNPNLSIIEINDHHNNSNDNNTNDEIPKETVVIIDGEALDDATTTIANTKSPGAIGLSNVSDKRLNKAECLAYCGKEKLNIDIAEASAAEYQNKTTTTTNEKQKEIQQTAVDLPKTKREIKIYDTLDEFEQHLPDTVTVLNTPFGSKVYLVGTAHFSEESQDDVSFVIRNVRPDGVMVELCPSRIHILKLDEKTLLEEAKNFNLTKIRDIIHTHGTVNGIFFILLLQFSAQIAKDLGMAPGGEFRRAFEEVHRLPGCVLQLGDRPVRITLKRALRALSMWQTMKLVWRLMATDTISIEEVEECKQRDLLEKLMQDMAGEFPAFSDVFVKERDMFLTHSLQMAALPQLVATDNGQQARPVRVVGVVGIGHAKGIAEMWGKVDPSKLQAIIEIPPSSRSTRICKFTLKYGLIGLTAYGAFRFFKPRLIRFF